ncbi:MAG: hypothetical protein LWX07_07685 [Bacteroidetes bacterium]|nr:hypothetical protein [Bacteroidota bacterium]
MEANVFREFFGGIVDYAGMFPPAGLTLTKAFRNYIAYLESEDEWMLSKFVCSVKSFLEIFEKKGEPGKYLQDYSGTRWVDFSLLSSGGANPKDFKTGFEKECAQIRKILDAHTEKISVDTLEVKIQPELVNTFGNHALKKLLGETDDILNSSGLMGIRIFIEPPVGDKFKTFFAKAAEAAAETCHQGGRVGFKLRTGGVTAADFPTVEQVAYALKVCGENKIQFKATAGLHHPVRHYNRSVNAKMHGFLNVFGAGILLHANTLSMSELEDIVTDETSTGFSFSDDTFYWNDISADAEKTLKARAEFVRSFGSCSFDEPREDLKNLGLWF